MNGTGYLRNSILHFVV